MYPKQPRSKNKIYDSLEEIKKEYCDYRAMMSRPIGKIKYL